LADILNLEPSKPVGEETGSGDNHQTSCFPSAFWRAWVHMTQSQRDSYILNNVLELQMEVADQKKRLDSLEEDLHGEGD
jgi:hypothetical protein